MKVERKWIKLVALCLGFPSTIFAVYATAWLLIKEDIISKPVGFGISTIIVLYFLFLIGSYGFKRKD